MFTAHMYHPGIVTRPSGLWRLLLVVRHPSNFANSRRICVHPPVTDRLRGHN